MVLLLMDNEKEYQWFFKPKFQKKKKKTFTNLLIKLDLRFE